MTMRGSPAASLSLLWEERVSDQVERLRRTAAFIAGQTGEENARWIHEAANEIERLRKELETVQDHRARVGRNRDMWKAQCERQAEQLRALSVPSDQRGTDHA